MVLARTRALGILASRAVRDGLINWTTAEGFFATEGNSERPVPRTMREWARKSPDYPERVLRGDIIRSEELPSWARRQLKNSSAMVQQTHSHRSSAGKSTPNKPATVGGPPSVIAASSRKDAVGGSSLGEYLIFLGGLWAVAHVGRLLLAPDRRKYHQARGPTHLGW